MDDLLNAALDGDKSAENKIFKILLERFRLFARRKIRDRDIADEIAHQACLAILGKYRQEEFSVSFRAWAYGVLKMKIRNYFYHLKDDKARLSEQDDLDNAEGASFVMFDPYLEMQLLSCMEKIIRANPKYARVLNLNYQGFKTEEICSKLIMSANNYYVTLNRARSLLIYCLEKGDI